MRAFQSAFFSEERTSMEKRNDTVCAIMTPLLSGATGAVRISGPEAFTIAETVFSVSLADKPGHTLHYGVVYDSAGRALDDVVASVYRAPKSFTGEDIVEFSCHGSVYVLRELVKALISHGARQAQRGEFSKRAFMNGKIDMAQAQGIIDLIESESEKEAWIAYRHLSGSLSKKIEEIRQPLLEITAQILAYIDYPDDEIGEISSETLQKSIFSARDSIVSLKRTFDSGKLVKEGLTVCLCGKPNAGKSMLLNQFAGYDRSIVTAIAGTTRDAVEETVEIGGMKVRLWDTAGLRETEDEVEKIGVSIAEEKMRSAQLILAVFDGSRPLDEEDRKICASLQEAPGEKIALLNKQDLISAENKALFSDTEAFLEKTGCFSAVCRVSAKKGEGMELVRERMTSLFGKIDPDEEIITDFRQYQCLVRAEEAIGHAVQNLSLTPDVLLADIEDAISALGTVTGKSVGEEVIETIFSRFCVGK